MKAIDLFAGAGGFSTGAKMAGCNVVWAANHWQAAVDIHALNHPGAAHSCQDLQQADWTQVPAHDLLMASPACQGHSHARGKDRPHHDALRATAWAVVDAAECHRPAVAVIENVPEFAKWVLYPAWCAALHALGYALSPMILDAADHGVAQNRRRLFVVATRSAHPVELGFKLRSVASAAEIIDFRAGKWRPVEGHVPRTIARIAAGRRAHGNRFVAPYYGSGSGETGRCLSRPLGTITTKDRWAVIDGDRMRMLTTAESRRAMGFPDSYLLPENHKDALHMLGNAVCPPVARDVINALREVV